MLLKCKKPFWSYLNLKYNFAGKPLKWKLTIEEDGYVHEVKQGQNFTYIFAQESFYFYY